MLQTGNPPTKKAACFNEVHVWDVKCVTIIMQLSCEGVIDQERSKSFYHSVIYLKSNVQ